MKIFFDTNVYVAEALLGEVAEEMVAATRQASWRIYASGPVAGNRPNVACISRTMDAVFQSRLPIASYEGR